MTIPQLTLLLFALWTLLIVVTTIGGTRWYLILTRRSHPQSFRADEPHGSPRYRRAMRAHANCVENLPVYGAIIFALTVLQLNTGLLNTLAIIFILARVCQTVTHIAFIDNNPMLMLRFSFFVIQLVIMFWMGILAITTFLNT